MNAVPPYVGERFATLTLYQGAKRPKPFRIDDIAWPENVEGLRDLLVQPSPAPVIKADGTRDTVAEKVWLFAIAPHRLREGTTRAAENVEAITQLVIDVDGASLVATLDRIKAAGIAAVVYTSPSDDPTGDPNLRRFRVISPITRDIAPSECERTRKAFADLVGIGPGCGVEGTCNADRLFFIGGLAGTAPREFYEFSGAPVDVDALPEPSAAWVTAAPAAALTAAVAPAVARVGNPVLDAATAAVLAALGSWEDYPGRKWAICGALGGMLRKAHWPEAVCAAIIRMWLPKGNPAVAVEPAVEWALGAWLQPFEFVTGREKLVEVVGPVIGGLIFDAAMLPSKYQRVTTIAAALAATPAEAVEYRILCKVDWRHPPELRYVVPGLELAPGKVSVIQGFAYTSKTPFALQLAICVAAGKPFLGYDVKQCAVAYLDHEGGGLTQQRAVRICYGLEVDFETVPLEIIPPRDQFSGEYMEELERLIRETNLGMVVIDTYASAFPAADGGFNDSSFRVWADQLGVLARNTGCLIVVVIHETKSARGQEGIRGISGHGSLAGAVQAAIALERPDEDVANVVTVRCARATCEGFDTFDVRWDNIECAAAPTGKALVASRIGAGSVDKPSGKGKTKRVASSDDRKLSVKVIAAGRAIMASLQPVVYTDCKEVIRLSGERSEFANKALAKLVTAGLLTVIKGGYSLTDEGKKASVSRIASVLGAVEGNFSRNDVPASEGAEDESN